MSQMLLHLLQCCPPSCFLLVISSSSVQNPLASDNMGEALSVTCAGQAEEGRVEHVGHGEDCVGEVDAQEGFADVQKRHWGSDVAQPEVAPHHIPEVGAAKAQPHLHTSSACEQLQSIAAQL